MDGTRTLNIHPTAIVSPSAELADGVTVGPYTVIGDGVRIGEGTVIGPHTVLQGPARIGRDNHFFGQSAVGNDPQDLKYKGEESFLQLGDRNQIREFVTINRGTEGGGGKTVIGDGNLLMTGVHVAHDCWVGNEIILGNAVTFAGHVVVEDYANVGAFSGVQQFCRVGRHAFVGGYSVITRDVLPFIKVVGVRSGAEIFGINTIGLERRGFSPERIQALKDAYRLLFRKKLRLAVALERLPQEVSVTEDVRHLLNFMTSSEQGFIR